MLFQFRLQTPRGDTIYTYYWHLLGYNDQGKVTGSCPYLHIHSRLCTKAGLWIFLSNPKANHMKTTDSQAQRSKDGIGKFTDEHCDRTPRPLKTISRALDCVCPSAARWGSRCLSVLLELWLSPQAPAPTSVTSYVITNCESPYRAGAQKMSL